jgi:O-antigen/teichoic acid export membrane protein
MSEVGVYSLGYRLGSMINVLLIMPFGLIWAPIRMQNFKNKNYDFFVTKVISYFFLIGIFIVFVATIYNDILMKVFFKNNQYIAASKIFPIVMLALLVFGLQSILDFGIYYYKKIYYYIIISIFGIFINVGLNIIFIPKYGYLSAAYITLITYLFTTTLIFIVSNKYHLIKIEWARILILCFFLFFFYYLACYTDTFKSFGHLKRIVLLFFSAWIVYRFWLDKKERNQISNFIKKRLRNEN